MTSFPWSGRLLGSGLRLTRLDEMVMIVLPVFAPGVVIVVEERWRRLPSSSR